jgi:hypothetical protein
MDSENVETRIQHLADALAAVTAPLIRLSEYAGNLEKLISDHQVVEAECVAALIRVEAGSLKARLVTTLDAVQEAATKVASL